MLEALAYLHVIELGVVVLAIPFIAAHLYVALKAKRVGGKIWKYVSLLMLLAYMVGLGFLMFPAMIMLMWILWPPSY
jgi:hypothetical protein